MTSAIIVAAGRGTRMGPDVDKLFLEVSGRPVVAHTWKRFDATPGIDDLVLVVRAGLETAFHDLAASLQLTKPFQIVAGGRERQDSVWNGLAALPEQTDVVAIQDGARPCTSTSTITATVEAARAHGAAVAAQRVTDTIKTSDDGRTVQGHLDRSRLWAVQTPQAFRVSIIRQALAAVRDQGRVVTDDTAACELIGQTVHLVEAPEPNPKVTVPSDLPYVELLLQRRV